MMNLIMEIKPIDRYKIEITVEGRQRTISLVDTFKKLNTNPTVIKTATIRRVPFSGGKSQLKTEMVEECEKLNNLHRNGVSVL